jgi:hypothetical protein
MNSQKRTVCLLVFLFAATMGFAQGVLITNNPADVVWSDTSSINLVTPTDPDYVIGSPTPDPWTPLGFLAPGDSLIGDSGSAFGFLPSGVTVVPEPSSSALFAAALLAVAGWRRLRNARHLMD